MTLSDDHMAMLREVLSASFVPHLPALVQPNAPADQVTTKNLSRAFAAFALRHLAGVEPAVASAAVVDDFDDYGIDAIFMHGPSDTLYLVQAKLKASEQFSQSEALAFCQGIRKLIRQDYTGFNQHVQRRSTEIEQAIENCARIQLVVAHVGSGVSGHAKQALSDLLEDSDHGEERFDPLLSYDDGNVVRDLSHAKALASVDAELRLDKCESITMPRPTYFGLVALTDLIKLHRDHGEALYARNIRSFLGHRTSVNTSIRSTLAETPQNFFYLNNGVAALCKQIEVKGKARGGPRKLKLRGLSVINGAQTIASAARYLDDNVDADLTQARVHLTLIRADSEDDFGKAVTRARNHQNPVTQSDFVALDDEQERIRRDLAHLGMRYEYKAGLATSDPDTIQVAEAAHALALFQADPRFVVWAKNEPAKLLDLGTEPYRMLFGPSLTAFHVVNAVRFRRFVEESMRTNADAAAGQERLIYRHGSQALGWLLAKRVGKAQQAAVRLDGAALSTALSNPFDMLRQALWDETKLRLVQRGPRAFFKTMTEVIPLLAEILIKDCQLAASPAVVHKRANQSPDDPYLLDLFEYVVANAPQIGNLS